MHEWLTMVDASCVYCTTTLTVLCMCVCMCCSRISGTLLFVCPFPVGKASSIFFLFPGRAICILVSACCILPLQHVCCRVSFSSFLLFESLFLSFFSQYGSATHLQTCFSRASRIVSVFYQLQSQTAADVFFKVCYYSTLFFSDPAGRPGRRCSKT